MDLSFHCVSPTFLSRRFSHQIPGLICILESQLYCFMSSCRPSPSFLLQHQTARRLCPTACSCCHPSATLIARDHSLFSLYASPLIGAWPPRARALSSGPCVGHPCCGSGASCSPSRHRHTSRPASNGQTRLGLAWACTGAGAGHATGGATGGWAGMWTAEGLGGHMDFRDGLLEGKTSNGSRWSWRQSTRGEGCASSR